VDDHEEGEQDNWTVTINKKLRQCMETISDQPSSTESWSIGLIATEAADHLSQRVQHLDDSGYALK